MLSTFYMAFLIAAGVLLQRRRPELARRIARTLPIVLFVFLVCLLTTGAHPLGARTNEAHRWIGHGLVSLSWLALWFSLGVLLMRDHIGPAIARCLIPVAAVFFVVLASFTGYLVPWDQLAIWRVTHPPRAADGEPQERLPGMGGAAVVIDEITLLTDAADARYGLLGERFVDEVTLNRFIMIHMVAVPTLFFLSLLGWWHLFRPRRATP